MFSLIFQSNNILDCGIAIIIIIIIIMASFYDKGMMKQENNDGCGSKEQELNVKLNR